MINPGYMTMNRTLMAPLLDIHMVPTGSRRAQQLASSLTSSNTMVRERVTGKGSAESRNTTPPPMHCII